MNYSEGGEALEQVARRGCGCPRDVAAAPSLEVFKARLDEALSSLV